MWLLISVIIVVFAVSAFLLFNPQFGGKVTNNLKVLYAQSSQWDGKKFNNSSETLMDINLRTLPGLLKQQFTNRKGRTPSKPLPVLPIDTSALNDDSKPKFIWFGHSVLLLQIDGKNLLIDPMFGPNAAPIAPFAVKRFSENTLDLIDQLPPLDLILMTHDHYDHLDYASIKQLRGKSKQWFVALGVSRHLERWGIPKSDITEFDWWQKDHFQGIDITFTPSRHFSGRGPTDRAKCLWGGWVFKAAEYNIYWSGDSGYDSHFKEIGERLGPFDWGFMECGQYNKLWHAIHMYPEETVQSSLDAQVKQAVPVHWGGFPLALHSWKDPIERFVMAAEAQDLNFLTPELGAMVRLGENQHIRKWWKDFD